MSIKAPVGVKVLTNVAVVRLKKGGKNFEIACYRNKVRDWRSKKEDDISEVLQVEKIFSRVESGEAAKKKDIQKVFGNIDEEQVIVEILNKGDMQVSE